MAVSATIGGSSADSVGGGIADLPTPVKLALAGGALGLVVFLTRSKTSGGSNPSNSTTIPNTNILLGSLQESILNLQGQVGSTSADLSSQLTGTSENLSSALDQWGGSLTNGQQTLQQGLAGISTGIGNLSTQQTNDTNALATQNQANTAALASGQATYYQGIIQTLGSLGNSLGVIQNQNQQTMAALSTLQNTPAQVTSAGGFTSNNDVQIPGGDSANWLMQRPNGSKYWIHFRNGGTSLEGA